ncbi:MAG TPA: hypothetical protein PLT03_03670 [Bacillota bacterium]|nr:hypothetical protein [Bacillota bacterium]HOG52953.1 hypothetical protein [Bacillota bacterium]
MKGLAYTIMAARKAAVSLDRVKLSLTRGEQPFEVQCRIYRPSGDTGDQFQRGSVKLIGSAGISSRQDFALALEDPADDVQPGDRFAHPHTGAPCQVTDVKIITAEGLACAKTAIARSLDGFGDIEA